MNPDRPRLLDLYCGAGGAAKGYADAGFDVTGVDHAPQPRYPFRFVQADALAYLREHGREFDAVHASPPCQKYLRGLGAVNQALGRAAAHPDRIARRRDALQSTVGLWVIENVEGAPLRAPVLVCGSHFGLPLRRHRLFESSHFLLGVRCDHTRQREKRYWTSWRPGGERRAAGVVQVYGNGGDAAQWAAAMGIAWMTRAELSQAIPPVYTYFLGLQLRRYLEAA